MVCAGSKIQAYAIVGLESRNGRGKIIGSSRNLRLR